MRDQSSLPWNDIYGPVPPRALINSAQNFSALRYAEKQIMNYGGVNADLSERIRQRRKEIASDVSKYMVDAFGWASLAVSTDRYREIIVQFCGDILSDEIEMVTQFILNRLK